MRYLRIGAIEQQQMVVNQLKALETEHYQTTVLIEANGANAADDPEAAEQKRKFEDRLVYLERAIMHLRTRYASQLKRAESLEAMQAAQAAQKKKGKGGQ